MPRLEVPEDDAPQSVRERHPAFEFSVRHIDDAPNIHNSRYLPEVITKAAKPTLGFASVGEVVAATKIMEMEECLTEHLPDDVKDMLGPTLLTGLRGVSLRYRWHGELFWAGGPAG
ncbi:hypothetical protein MCOR25_007353 [Pyricularia grisea]|nr:hypothetical protein MCOR25_007353 [Pyricularia grisea]